MPTVTCFPSRSTTAVLGAMRKRFFSASVVRPFDMASSVLPTVISAGIIAADSKYSRSWYRPITSAPSAPAVISPHIA